MYLGQLSMVNFRNYESADLTFKSKINLIYGLNAQGKTNFLEAIYLLCLGRSFRQATNQDILRIGSSYFTIKGHLNLDNHLEKVVALQYIKNAKKEVSVDRKRLQGHSEIFGSFPVVVISPDDYKITSGGPSERRRFIDILLSQVSVSYLGHLQDYHRVLKQRNKILQDMKTGMSVAESTLEPWTEKMITAGSKILRDRHHFISEYSRLLDPVYREYSTTNDSIAVVIDSIVLAPDFESNYISALKKYAAKERALGVSLVGPHRDDLVISINGRDIRTYGSRGEHKSVVIALKLAELQFLKIKRDETPIFLLDDCFSELDDIREQRVFSSLQGLGQMFITSPRERSVLESIEPENISKYHVQNGVIFHH